MLGLRTLRTFRGLQKLVGQQVSLQNVRYRSGLPLNTIIVFTPQQEAWVVERFGKFHRTLEPGLNILVPVIDSVKYVQSMKEVAIGIPQQSAITEDNVTLQIDGVLYLRVFDPYKTSYGVEDAEFAITQLAQTTMRSEIGKMSLDSLFRERDSLNVAIVEAINKAAKAWGVDCQRYEIRDIRLPDRVQEAMQMQVEAERKKRAAVLESEGIRAADINIAEGKKQARILQSEATKAEQINNALGEAEAILARATARAKAIEKVASSLKAKNGHSAVSITIAELYIQAFSNLAKQGNTLLLPTNTGDVTSMVTQAMSIYKQLNSTPPSPQESQTEEEQSSGIENIHIPPEILDPNFYDEKEILEKLQDPDSKNK